MSTVRRRSPQYSLFPSCSPTPLQNNAAILPSNGDIGNLRKLKTRHSEGSVRERATNMSLRSSPSANDFAKNFDQQPKRSDTWDRLIPLKLEASMSDTKSSPASQKSLPFLPLAELTSISTSSPLDPFKPTKKSRPSPVTDLTILPYTQKEWATVMEEVRMLYSKGLYKHCAMRCKQILNGIKDPYGVHPLYSIFLSFFAASSLEMTASTLHNHTSTKAPLLQESLAFYQKAESFVEYASLSSDRNTAVATPQISIYGHASHSSISSSIHSSVDSVFSQASASPIYSASSSSYGDSPTSEEFSLKRSGSNSSEEESKSTSRRSGSFQTHKKKVSFSPQLPTLSSETTLDLCPNSSGAGNAAADASALLDAFPAPPSKESSPSPASSPTKSPRGSYYIHQSVTRYHKHLISLKTQLNFHISSINAQISTMSEMPPLEPSNTPTQYLFDEREGGEKSRATGEVREESRKPELRERIRRLKESGWMRKRFDGEKYRVLCEKALGEVNERP